MLRRIYYLFPKKEPVEHAVSEIQGLGVARRYMHTVAREGVDIEGLPEATVWQRTDFSAKLERYLWNANLGGFFLFAVVFAAGLFAGSVGWAIFSALMMLATIALGYWFATSVPQTHMDQARVALRHREILLMVDVPRWNQTKVQDHMRAHHPEAELSGVGWSIEELPI